ncbi:hypothetical protein BH24GEM2_BH24GEM2_17090 [soil metagenome]
MLPAPVLAEIQNADNQDRARLREWVQKLRAARLHAPAIPLGRGVARTGELALGTPYEAYTLEAYLKSGGSPARTEPLTLSLTRFDCVSLVEACVAVARVARAQQSASWEAFGREMERMRYREGKREGYTSRLHYFSEWISGCNKARREIVGPLRYLTQLFPWARVASGSARHGGRCTMQRAPAALLGSGYPAKR